MSDAKRLAEALEALLWAIRRYDAQVPTETRLTRQHDELIEKMLGADVELAVFWDNQSRRTLDGERAPEYVNMLGDVAS